MPILVLFGIMALGVLAQWVALRFRLPAIVLLLGVGVLAGPVLGVLDTSAMPADVFDTVVSIAVAIILFEGGLQLKLDELRKSPVIIRLLSVGGAISFIATTVMAVMLLGWSFPLALLMGAILIVTGPTVIMPMLQHVRPKARVADILKWEGILNDPMGAVVAVIVLEAILAGDFQSVGWHVLVGLVATVATGTVMAGLGTLAYFIPARYRWLPESLMIPWVLTLVVGLLCLTNLIQEDAGLLAVTLMGVMLANQSRVDIRDVIRFSAPVQTLLIATLFIMLSTHLTWSQITAVRPEFFWMLLAVVFVARPLAVYAATWRTSLNWKEKLFIALIAPRGIVAAAVASVMGLGLQARGVAQAEEFLPMMFFMILGTIGISSVLGQPLAHRLKLVEESPQGVMLIGADSAAQWLAMVLKSLNVRVLLMDVNSQHIRQCIFKGLPAVEGSVLNDTDMGRLQLYGLGYAICVTSSDKLNLLARHHLRPYFEKDHILVFRPSVHNHTQPAKSKQIKKKPDKSLDKRIGQAASTAVIEAVADPLVQAVADATTPPPSTSSGEGPSVTPTVSLGDVLGYPGRTHADVMDWAYRRVQPQQFVCKEEQTLAQWLHDRPHHTVLVIQRKKNLHLARENNDSYRLHPDDVVIYVVHTPVEHTFLDIQPSANSV